jgi:hypothetical protein
MSLAEVYDAYLLSKEDKRDRDPHRLFVSDVGRCPKAVALRMSQAKKKPISDSEARNQRLMWDLAEYIEGTLADALFHEGLIDVGGYQMRVPIDDRDNWGGRLDILTLEPRIIEVKTVRSNAFRFDDRPKKEHIYQAAIYSHYLETPATLVYFDRGGSNTPEEYEVEHEWEPIRKLMDELDAVREALPALPDMLPKVLKYTDRSTKLKLVPDWRCGYCDYSEASCHPDMSTETWAELKGAWTPTKKADLDQVVQWATEQADTALLTALS